MVHAGPLYETQLYQGLLEAENIPAHVPDANLRVLDPYYVGGAPLISELRVPREYVSEARALVEAYRQDGAKALAQMPEFQHDVEASTSDAAQQERLETLARRTRWLSLFWIIAPLAIFMGLRYWVISRRESCKSESHALTLASIALAMIGGLGYFIAFFFPEFVGLAT